MKLSHGLISHKRAIFCGWLLAVAALASANVLAAGKLCDDLGGESGVVTLVDQFLCSLADDRRIKHFFAETNRVRFRTQLIERFCAVSGRPCRYTGNTMQQSHAGMGVNTAVFTALVEDLIEAMERCQVATGAQNRLLALFAPMHVDIIERRQADSTALTSRSVDPDGRRQVPLVKVVRSKRGAGDAVLYRAVGSESHRAGKFRRDIGALSTRDGGGLRSPACLILMATP